MTHLFWLFSSCFAAGMCYTVFALEIELLDLLLVFTCVPLLKTRYSFLR